MVEFGLVWLPLFCLLFGIVDVSFIIFVRTMFQSAVREGVRFAITYSLNYNGQTCTSQTQCVQYVLQGNTLGFLAGTVNGQAGTSYIQVNYYSKDNLSTPLQQNSLPVTLSDGTVVKYLNQTGNLIEVQIRNYPWKWFVPLPTNYLAGSGMQISVSASDVLQGLPIGQTVPPSP
jgi:Flp pilus assembly protein TadG